MKMGRKRQILKNGRPIDKAKFESFLKERRDFVVDLCKMWQRMNVTAVVGPIWPHCAPLAATADVSSLFLEYGIFWNVNGFPSGVLPITRVLPEE